MKNSKLLRFFSKDCKQHDSLLPDCLLPGFLAAFLLAGCFNPITAIPPKSGDPVTDPFTVDIFIGKDGSARSVAGPDSAQIKGSIRNFMQLIVVDDDNKAIVAFGEDRRINDEDTEGVLSINSIAFDRNYHFLLLMGHWERDDNYDENYKYYDGTNGHDFRPPTLLAAGLKKAKVTGSGKISVVMWPIVVDTVFSTDDGNLTAAPVITTGNPGKVTLRHPVDWNVIWTIKQGATGNGFTDLVKAQQVIPAYAEEEALQLKSKPQTMVRIGAENGTWTPIGDEAALNGKIITQPIKTYTSGITKIGTEGSVNFKLEYIPFNLKGTEGTNPWNKYDGESIFDLSKGGPVWIIRNGVNDETQKDDTDFTKFGNKAGYNGNGAVRFVIAPKTPANGSTLKIEDGKFLGPGESKPATTPNISFTTGGYEGEAEVYYAVVEKGHIPDHSDYTGKLNSVAATVIPSPPDLPEPHKQQITLLENQVGGGYDVYVIIYKDGEVSDHIVINTAAGDEDVDWIWGDEVYIRSNGLDTNRGDPAHPLKTVQKALEKISGMYTSTDWPGETSVKIVIMDTVEVAEMITIDNDSKKYPPIVLTDKGNDGILQALNSISIKGGDTLLKLTNSAKVTLEGSLTLAGTRVKADNIRGVYVSTGGEFTMNGGKISGNQAYYYGGGVFVKNDGKFTMNGGEILVNQVDYYGGGVFVDGDGEFTMSGGKISGNQAYYGGGGVFVKNGGEFIMVDDGVIEDNSSQYDGGGVYVTGSMFTMDGGKISDNYLIQHGLGGGVYVQDGTFTMNKGEISNNRAQGGGGVSVQGGNSTFTMIDGEISGNCARAVGGFAWGGGVFIGSDIAFKKTGGIIYGYDSGNLTVSNVVETESGSVWDGQGHSLFVNGGSYWKDTTLWSNDNLYHNISGENNSW
ncbi:MAG: hypothetical protein LBB98_06095 [Treponema sp.]|nr:hypothetical protein [Treponema sp.]